MDDAKLVASWDGQIAVKCFIKLPLFANSPLKPIQSNPIVASFVLYTPGFQRIYSTREIGFLHARADGVMIIAGPFYDEQAAIEAVIAAAKHEVARAVLPAN